MPITVENFLSTLRGTEFENSFNPYRHVCSVHDRDESPIIRAKILEDLLEAASSTNVDAIWIGRDLGYRGGRRTGLALTDDLSFDSHLSRWGVASRHPSSGPRVKERTATVVWELLNKVSKNVFLWNVFPFHPHQADNQFSNRAHNAYERSFGVGLLEQLVELLNPAKIVAIGNDAAKAAEALNTHCDTVHVRHPSYGGQIEFSQKIISMYDIEIWDQQPRLI